MVTSRTWPLTAVTISQWLLATPACEPAPTVVRCSGARPGDRPEVSEQCERQTGELFEGAVVGDQGQLAGEGEGGQVGVHPQLR